MHRLRVILLCVFAATTFWILNALNENYSTTLKYPLQFIYDQEEYIAVDKLPEEIQVNVSGLGWNLFRNSMGIKVTPLRIILETPTEVNKITSGALPALISDQMNDVELNYVLTDTLNINIDKRVQRKFLLDIDSANIPLEDNYRITTKVRQTPDSVLLEGPSGIINNMPDTLLLELPQTDIDSDYKEAVSVLTPNNNLITRNPPAANITFGVSEFVKDGENVSLKTANFPKSGMAYIKDNAVPVKFLVSKDRQDDITSEDFEVIVNFSTMNPADSSILPQLKTYPGHLQEVSLDTALRVKVYFSEE